MQFTFTYWTLIFEQLQKTKKTLIHLSNTSMMSK